MRKLAGLSLATVITFGLVALGAAPSRADGPTCTITVTDSNVTLSGTNSSDVVCLNGDNDTFNALGGDDTVIDNGDNNTVNLGDGYDTFDGTNGDGAVVNGGPGDDQIIGTPGPDDISGDDGNDTLIGESGDDTLNGGAGNDQLVGGPGADDLYGESGADSLDGGGGNDVLAGGADIDTIDGGAGVNTCDYTKNEVKTSTCQYDDTPPSVADLSFATQSIDTNTSNQNLPFSLQMADATGVDYVRFSCSLSAPNGYTYRAFDFTYSTATERFTNNAGNSSISGVVAAGNITSLLLSGNLAIRKGQFPGTYDCQVEAQDVAMNKVTLPAGQTFDVIRALQGFDDAAPTISNVAFSKNPVDAGPAADHTTVSFDISDDTGAQWGYFTCSLNDGNVTNRVVELGWSDAQVFDYKSPGSGTSQIVDAHTKHYSIDVGILQGTPPGDYSCDFWGQDIIDNRHDAFNVASLTVNRSGTDFDSDPPTLAVTTTDSKVDVGAQAQTVSLILHETDVSGSVWSYLSCQNRSNPSVVPISIGFNRSTVVDYTTLGTLDSYDLGGSSVDLTVGANFVIPFGYQAGVYDCSARVQDTLGHAAWPANLVSFSVYRTPAGLPGQVLLPSFQPSNPTSGTVSWQAPTFAGDPALYAYDTQISLDGQTWTNVPNGATQATSLALSNLRADTNYWLRIRGENGGVLGQDTTYMDLNWSAFQFRTPAPIAADPPTELGISNVTQNTASLSWFASGYNGGAPITDFRVQLSKDGGLTWQTPAKSASTSLSFVVRGLSPGTRYEVRISAINSAGQSEYLTGGFTSLAGTPQPPSNLHLVANATSSVTLVWSLPISNGGSNLTDYKVEIAKSCLAYVVVPHVASVNLSLKASGLAAGTKYCVRVSSKNSIGYSAPSLPLQLVTSGNAPAAPTGLAVKSLQTSVLLSWKSAVVSGGSPVRNYVVEYSKDAGQTWLVIPKSVSTSTTLTVTGLKPKTAYRFRVTAVNDVGSSITSKVLSVRTA